MQVGRVALKPPGQARLDWQVVCELGNRMGYPMKYDTIEEVFRELVSLAPSYEGLTYENMGATGRLWPHDRQILFDDTEGFPSGPGKLVP